MFYPCSCELWRALHLRATTGIGSVGMNTPMAVVPRTLFRIYVEPGRPLLYWHRRKDHDLDRLMCCRPRLIVNRPGNSLTCKSSHAVCKRKSQELRGTL